MGTSREDIRGWLKAAKNEGATHMLVVCDTFDWEDYPVSVMPGKDPRKVAEEEYGYPGEKGMQKVMECYSLSLDIETQVKDVRSWNW